MAAASYSSLGMARRPARKMIVQNGRYFQMWNTITAPSAVQYCASHGTEGRPNSVSSGELLEGREDVLDALDALVGRLLGRPLVDGDPRHGLAPDVLVVHLRERRVLPVVEDLVLAVEEDRRGHWHVHIFLALRPLVALAPERI